ncbi:MAG: hypothetical protein WC071_13530, partial [Victivallaceae bacterium]
EQLAGLQDVLPTLCALSGLPIPSGLDGIDLSEAIRNPKAPGRDYFVSQTLDSPLQKYMYRDLRWKYIYSEAGGVEELYDTTLPDYELRNFAGDPACKEILTGMRKKLIAWCVKNGDFNMLDESRQALKKSNPEILDDQEFKSSLIGWRKY